MSLFTEDARRTKLTLHHADVELTPAEEPAGSASPPQYDDRYVWYAFAGIGALTPVLCTIALLTTPGTGVLTDLWLGFGGANLVVWPIVLIAGVVSSARRALESLRGRRRGASEDRRIIERSHGIEAAAA